MTIELILYTGHGTSAKDVQRTHRTRALLATTTFNRKNMLKKAKELEPMTARQ